MQSLEVVRGVATQDGELVVVLDELDRDTPLEVRTLVEAGAGVQRVAALDSGLEAAYLSIIGEQPSLTATPTNGAGAVAGEVRT
jgi:hypothetical protein